MKIDLKALKAARKYTAAYFITAVAANPKRPGSIEFNKYAKGYAVGRTVAAARAAGGLSLANVDFDLAKGYISLSTRKPTPKISDTDKVTALSIASEGPLGERLEAYFGKCEEKLGFVPNVLKAYAFSPVKLQAFADMYNDLMLAPSALSKLEREMIGVVVSSANHCHYCLVAHGAAVRQLSGEPGLGEVLAANYRAAALPPRQKAMLDFAWKLTVAGHEIEEKDREGLRTHGFADRDIWDIAAVASFFNMTNRMASAVDMRPNANYHALARD